MLISYVTATLPDVNLMMQEMEVKMERKEEKQMESPIHCRLASQGSTA